MTANRFLLLARLWAVLYGLLLGADLFLHGRGEEFPEHLCRGHSTQASQESPQGGDGSETPALCPLCAIRRSGFVPPEEGAFPVQRALPPAIVAERREAPRPALPAAPFRARPPPAPVPPSLDR